MNSISKWGFPDGSDNKKSACISGDLGLIPDLGRSSGEGIHSTPVFLPGELENNKLNFLCFCVGAKETLGFWNNDFLDDNEVTGYNKHN